MQADTKIPAAQCLYGGGGSEHFGPSVQLFHKITVQPQKYGLFLRRPALINLVFGFDEAAHRPLRQRGALLCEKYQCIAATAGSPVEYTGFLLQ